MKNAKLSRHEWKSVVKDIFTGAYYTGSTHTHIVQSLKDRVYDPLGERTASGRRRYSPSDLSFILGYVEAQFEWVWQQVEFVYRDKHGNIYSTHRESDHATTAVFYDEGRGSELGDMEATHLWKHNGKAFGDWTVPNNR